MNQFRLSRLVRGRTQHQLIMAMGIIYSMLAPFAGGWLRPSEEQKKRIAKVPNFALRCSGNQYSVIRFCQITDCPLWYLRFGKMPAKIIQWEGKMAEKYFEEGGEFGPGKTIELLE